MKNASYLLGVFVGLMFAAGVMAQPTATNGPAMAVPAHNRLALADVSGKVRVLNSKGLILENNFQYLPLIKISDLSNKELHALLETKTAYAALTSFGAINERNAQSAAIENQFRQVWLQGKSLSEKIQTRLELLDAIRTYNSALAYLPSTVAAADRAAAEAIAANNRLAIKAEVAANDETQVVNAEIEHASGDGESWHQVHDARQESQKANDRVATASEIANAANFQSAAANQQVINVMNQCAAISAQLGRYGIIVPASAPFYPVPPLLMRSEVDAERMAN